jgi:hypothetical protein
MQQDLWRSKDLQYHICVNLKEHRSVCFYLLVNIAGGHFDIESQACLCMGNAMYLLLLCQIHLYVQWLFQEQKLPQSSPAAAAISQCQ